VVAGFTSHLDLQRLKDVLTIRKLEAS
jgi:hypothetical protein